MMIERSYGVIPFHKDNNVLKVFLIHQYGSAGDTLWTFPKGRSEKGESQSETALRELREETGMEATISTHHLTNSYWFTRAGEKVEKTVTYFVGTVLDTAFSIQEKEVKEAGWFSIPDAREKITFSDQKKLLDDAVRILDNSS